MPIVFIEDEQVARKLPEQLHGAEYLEADSVNGWSAVSLQMLDRVAVGQAMALAEGELGRGSTNPREMKFLIEGKKCLLPMPANREYNGDNPRIYVRCLTAYSNGDYHGMWINAAQEATEIKADIDWMLTYSPWSERDECKEWAIHSMEGFIGIDIGEYEELERVSKIALGIEEVKNNGDIDAYRAWARQSDEPEDLDRFVGQFAGEFRSAGEFVEELWSAAGVVAELEKIRAPLVGGFVSEYIDYDSIAHDLECSGIITTKRVGMDECFVFVTG